MPADNWFINFTAILSFFPIATISILKKLPFSLFSLFIIGSNRSSVNLVIILLQHN